jgi:dTDP-glucose 4,6-dehydratase
MFIYPLGGLAIIFVYKFFDYPWNFTNISFISILAGFKHMAGFWKSKKVIVTGGAGFIGSHLTEELVKQGADVTAFIRYNSRNSWGNLEFLDDSVKKSIKIVAGDLRDLYLLKKAVKGQDFVFHLGASIAIPYSYINPHDFIQTNVVGTTNVLTAALEANVQRFIHTSTSEAYGTPDKIPIPEPLVYLKYGSEV